MNYNCTEHAYELFRSILATRFSTKIFSRIYKKDRKFLTLRYVHNKDFYFNFNYYS